MTPRRSCLCGAIVVLTGLTAQAESVFSAQSRLILVPVTVADRNGMAKVDLRQEHFKVFDNAEQRPIVSFAREDAPMMLGIVLDLSGSMKSKLPHALAAIRALADTADSVDQGFLITFADRPALQVDLTSDLAGAVNLSRFPPARGGTALVDAVYQALEGARSTRHSRKALVVVSDGGDNASRHSEAELVAVAREADTQIYSISLQEHTPSKEERRGYYILQDLSKMTGGLHFLVRDRRELPSIAEKIALAVRNVYIIGYTPPQTATSGKWRSIRVVLDGAGKPGRVSAKSGYYAAE